MSNKATTKKDPLSRLTTLVAGSRVVLVETEKPKKGGYEKKGGNGGVRPGAGRKPTEASLSPDAAEMRRSHLQYLREHGNEKVGVKLVDNATGKTKVVKMTRIAIWAERLFGAVQKSEPWAIHEYGDRILGKAAQPLVGDEEAPIVLRVDF